MARVRWPKDKQLKKVNRLLLVLIILVNSYVILAPFWPQAQYLVETNITKPVDDDLSKLDRSTNRLIIKKLQLEETINEGPTQAALQNGLWRRPATSNPELGGNTVIVGHRFLYHGGFPPFYHLDKLAENDQVIVVYNQKIYVYKVFSQKITNPNDTSVEAESFEPVLTLYTCTPLLTAKDRLVYVSNLERIIE